MLKLRTPEYDRGARQTLSEDNEEGKAKLRSLVGHNYIDVGWEELCSYFHLKFCTHKALIRIQPTYEQI